MSFVSYAQNFEDVLLHRALGDVKKGRYLDIGAQDPLIDSVSHAFYLEGWRGVHVEATPTYAGLLRNARPDEIVIQAAVTGASGTIEFHEFPKTGLSTGKLDIADRHEAAGFPKRTIVVPCVTVENLLDTDAGEIHWMKVDVEGMELDVLRSWGESKKRPWVLVIEATYPSTQERTDHLWRDEVIGRGYTEAFFDGLSCYFVHEDHGELASRLAAPANVYDGFGIAPPHFAAFKMRGDVHAAENQALLQKGRADWFEREAAKSRDAHDVARQEQTAAVERLTVAEQAHRETLRNLFNDHRAVVDRIIQQHSETDRERRRELRQQDDELRKAVREAEKETAEARVGLARSEERNGHIQAALERAEQSLAATKKSLEESEARLGQSTREATELKSALARSRGELEQGAAHLVHLEREHAQERENNRAEIEQARREIERLRAEREENVTETERLRTESADEIGQLLFNLSQVKTLIAAAVSERPARWHRIGASLGFAGPSRALQRLAGWAPAPIHHSPEFSSQEYNATMHRFPSTQGRNPFIRANSLAELLAWEDADFVRCAYVTVLGRQPDAQGEAYYTDRVRRGYSKAQILWELRSSPEGPRHDPGIAGLDRALRRAKRTRMPLVGWLFRFFNQEEGGSETARRHRSLVNHLGRIISLQERQLEEQARLAARPAMVMPAIPAAANDPSTGAESEPGASSQHAAVAQVSDVATLCADARKLFDGFSGAKSKR